MDDQRKDHFASKRLPQKNCPKQQQTHNVPTCYVDNTESKNNGRDLLLISKSGTVPQWTQRMS